LIAAPVQAAAPQAGPARAVRFSAYDFASKSEAGAADLAKLGLRLDVQSQVHGDLVQFEGSITDLSGQRDRAVDVICRVPFDHKRGVLWWPDITGPAKPAGSSAAALKQRYGSPQTVLTFPPAKSSRWRVCQPAGAGCAKATKMMWVAELEAYGRDQNENLVRSKRVKRIGSDSTRARYSIVRVHDGSRNDRWEPNWRKRAWASDNTDKPHWIEIEFTEEAELARVDVYWSRERFGFATSQQLHLERWDGKQWLRVDAKASSEAPKLGDAEKAQFASRKEGSFTEVYPLGCVTAVDQSTGLCVAIPPGSPQVFRIEYDHGRKALALALKFGLSPLPRNPAVKSRAAFRFVLYEVDGKWGFRDAARRYYELFPDLFVRRTKLDGLWMLGDPLKVPNPHHYAYREHGEKQAELDEMWGIQTCPYVLVGQREFMTEATSHEQAMADYAKLDPTLRSFYGPGLKEIIDNCSLRHPDGRHITWLRRRGGSLKGPAVCTFPMNPDPSLWEGTERKTAGRGTLARVKETIEAFPLVDGTYVDSLSSWGGYLNARREHFEFADLPLTHDKAGNVVMDNAITHLEFLRELRTYLHGKGKILFGNGIRKKRAWAGFLCDVGGVEANRSVHRNAGHYAFFRTISYQKPFLLLYYWKYPEMDLPRHGVSEYVQSAVAFGIAPETRPFGKERARDMDLYSTFIPILRRINQAGWEPIPHGAATDRAVWLERFGAGKGGLFFTLYNPAAEAKTVGVEIDFKSIGHGAGLPIREIVTKVTPDLTKIELPAKSLRVLQVGDAPDPPTLPVIAPEVVHAKLLELRMSKWQGQGGLLANGSFEEAYPNGRLVGWRMHTGGDAELKVADDQAKAGKRSLYVRDADRESHAGVSQVFPYVVAGRQYVLSLWVKQAEGSAHPGRVYYQWRGKEGRIKQLRHNFPRSTTWRRCEWRLTAPEGAESIGLSVGSSKRDAGEMWIDDVSLAPAPAR